MFDASVDAVDRAGGGEKSGAETDSPSSEKTPPSELGESTGFFFLNDWKRLSRANRM